MGMILIRYKVYTSSYTGIPSGSRAGGLVASESVPVVGAHPQGILRSLTSDWIRGSLTLWVLSSNYYIVSSGHWCPRTIHS